MSIYERHKKPEELPSSTRKGKAKKMYIIIDHKNEKVMTDWPTHFSRRSAKVYSLGMFDNRLTTKVPEMFADDGGYTAEPYCDYKQATIYEINLRTGDMKPIGQLQDYFNNKFKRKD